MQFAMEVIYQKLSSNCLLFQNRLNDCHTIIVRRLIVLSIKHQTNKTICFISQTELMERKTQNFRTANNCK